MLDPNQSEELSRVRYDPTHESIRLGRLARLNNDLAATGQLLMLAERTSQSTQEISGMIRGSGYEVKIKPYSYGASKVADRYT